MPGDLTGSLSSVVTGASSTPEAASSPESAAPAPGGGFEGAVDAVVPEVEAAAPPPVSVPADDTDLAGLEGSPHVKAILGMRQQIRSMSADADNYRQQLQQYSERIDQMGGIELAEYSTGLMSKLFGAEVDPVTGQAKVDEYGVPIVNTAGFVSDLAEQNWTTVLDLTERLLELPTAEGEPLLGAVMRRVLGLDPNLLQIYQQIQAPGDAAKFNLAQISQDELDIIPADYHDTYRQMSYEERMAVQDPNLDDATRLQFMANKAQNLRWEEFRQNMEQEAEFRRQQEAQQQAQQVEQAGQQAVEQLWNQHAIAVEQEVARIAWHSDPNMNDFMHKFILGGVATYVQNDPAVAPMLHRTDLLMRQAVRLHAMGDQMRARQFQYQASTEAGKIVQKARQFAIRATQTLQSVMGLQPSPVESARPVLNGSGQPASGNMRQAIEGMKPFSPEWHEAVASLAK